MNDSTYAVSMIDLVEDAIDYSFSPVDGLIALTQIREHLPTLHRPKMSRRLVPIPRSKRLRLYHALIEWGDLAFVYVEWNGTLHVLGCYANAYRPNAQFDVVISTEHKVTIAESLPMSGDGVHTLNERT